MTALGPEGELAVLIALKRVVDKRVDPRGGEHGAPNARTEVSDKLLDLYRESGVDRIELRIGGKPVGTLSVRRQKARKEAVVTDPVALVKWLRESDGGRDALAQLVLTAPGTVLKAATAEGELPDGCGVAERPEAAVGTTARVSLAKVADALNGRLPDGGAFLLGEGE